MLAKSYTSYLFIYLFIYSIYLFNIDVGEKRRSAAPCMSPDWEPELQLRHVPQPAVEPTTFW